MLIWGGEAVYHNKYHSLKKYVLIVQGGILGIGWLL